MTELSDAEGLELLLAAETAGMGFSGFTTGELQTLARHMAFVELEVDERILEAGERASFAAIVLCGSLELVGTQPNVRKRSVFQGQFVGDRAYFEGGKRDAHCYSRSEGTVIAVLKYTAIHQLALTEVGIRLVRILGATSAALVTQGIQQEAAEEKLKFVPCLTDELTPLVLDLARVSQSPLLSTFTPEQLRTLAQLMMVSALENVSYGSCEGMSRLQVTEAAEGETILRAGRKSMHLCIVLTGEVEARVGRARLIHRQGDCVGSTATLRSAAHATDFVACCQVRLAVLTRDDLDQLPMHHADLYRTVIFAITRVSLAETAAVEALLAQAAEEGYARICVPLQDEPELAQRRPSCSCARGCARRQGRLTADRAAGRLSSAAAARWARRLAQRRWRSS